jgi:hypothetical protein
MDPLRTRCMPYSQRLVRQRRQLPHGVPEHAGRLVGATQLGLHVGQAQRGAHMVRRLVRGGRMPHARPAQTSRPLQSPHGRWPNGRRRPPAAPRGRVALQHKGRMMLGSATQDPDGHTASSGFTRMGFRHAPVASFGRTMGAFGRNHSVHKVALQNAGHAPVERAGRMSRAVMDDQTATGQPVGHLLVRLPTASQGPLGTAAPGWCSPHRRPLRVGPTHPG